MKQYSIAIEKCNSLATYSNAYHMTMKRQAILREIINARFNANQAEFARAIKKSSGQVNQWLTGYRAIGDGTARHIEITLNLPTGFMDNNIGDSGTGVPKIKEVVADPVIKDLAALEPEDADVWRAQIRAAAVKARRQQKEDREKASQPTDPPLEHRRTA